MFPFIVKGKVPLGLRREYQLSEAGLEERIAERLVSTPRRSQERTDGSPSGDGRGLIAGGFSRLKSMGFLTAVKVRKIQIVSRDDLLFARYEMDATASTLVSMVIIPLVLGSILFSHSAFSFYESLAILVLLMLTSWGMDVFILVMMLRHEIYQIASEIRGVLRRRDVQKIEPHHYDLSPEDMLATAYYYERNGLVRRCEAYLVHLTARHPDSLEAFLALEHMEHLEGVGEKRLRGRTREGMKKRIQASGGGASRVKRVLPYLSERVAGGGGKEKARTGSDAKGITGKGSRLRGLFNESRGRKSPSQTETGNRKGKRGVLFWRRPNVPGSSNGGQRPRDRSVLRREKRLARREQYAGAPGRKSLSWAKRVRKRLSRLLSWEGRDERRYRQKQERWLHGPDPPRSARRKEGGRNNDSSRLRRPVWMRSKEEKRSLLREKRWSEGAGGPEGYQKSRDRWGRLRLLSGRSRGERLTAERRERAVKEPPYAAGG